MFIMLLPTSAQNRGDLRRADSVQLIPSNVVHPCRRCSTSDRRLGTIVLQCRRCATLAYGSKKHAIRSPCGGLSRFHYDDTIPKRVRVAVRGTYSSTVQTKVASLPSNKNYTRYHKKLLIFEYGSSFRTFQQHIQSR